MGASLQTMHEEKFDHGVVLSQTPAPGLRIMKHPTLSRTNRKLAMECSELLVQGLRDGLHITPYENAGWKAAELEGKPLQHAPKITKADTEIDWLNWTPVEWTRRLQLNQAVWTMGQSRGANGPYHRRLLFHDAVQVPEEEVKGFRATMEVMTLGEGGGDEEMRFRKVISVNHRSGNVYLLLYKDVWLKLRRATLEGRAEKPASAAVMPFIVDREDSAKAPAKKEVEEKTVEKQLSWKNLPVW